MGFPTGFAKENHVEAFHHIEKSQHGGQNGESRNDFVAAFNEAPK